MDAFLQTVQSHLGGDVYVVLWVGLGIFTVTLLTAILTGWGEARPLWKCVALSVLAHVLFAGYAYATRLMLKVPEKPPEEVIQLAVVAEDDNPSPSRPGQQPWEQFVTDAPVQPDLVSLQKADADVDVEFEPANRFVAPVEIPPDDQPLPETELDVGEPVRPEPQTDGLEGMHPTTSPAAPARLEPVAVPRRVEQQRTIDAPLEAPPLERIRSDRLTTDRPLRIDQPRAAVEVPTEDLLPRLADIPLPAAEPVARPAMVDDPLANQIAAAPSPQSEVAEPDLAFRPSTVAQPLPAWAFGQTRNVPRRLGDGRHVPRIYQLRTIERRTRLAEHFGGNAQTESAVDSALAWLATSQSLDGRWDASAYGSGIETKVDGHDRFGAGLDADAGITGLALLAMLGAGHSHLEGKYRHQVGLGIDYLIRVQATDGNLAGSARLFARMYCHGMACLALSEAYAMTGDDRLRVPVERAIRYTIRSQDDSTGGWRYQPGDPGDLSQFGWQVMALKSAEVAGVDVPSSTHRLMEHFLGQVSVGRHGGRACYKRGHAPSTSMTAEALASRVFLDAADAQLVDEAVEFLLTDLPGEGTPNLYYWYYGTLALHQVQGEAWERWNKALVEQLLKRQIDAGRYTGSWEPRTVWGSYGGRVYSTAMAALCLEVYYRYLPLYQQVQVAREADAGLNKR